MIIKDTNYDIAEDGTVKNLRSGLTLKPQCNGKGYLKVYLVINGKKKSKYIHRLVAEAYIKKPRKRYCDQVNHKDGNKHNNDISNLEWVTNGENQKHRHKLKTKQ